MAMTWVDWLGQNPSPNVRVFRPARVTAPQQVVGLASEVAAFVKSQARVRAIAHRHADNTLGRPEPNTAAVDLDRVRFVHPLGFGATPHVYVGGGTRISEINEALWGLRLALHNLGSYDGQYLAAAVGTGTHGSGAELGCLADAVRAVDLVDGEGRCWRIEQPGLRWTDPGAFSTSHPGWGLVQTDADTFHSVVVSAGSIGVVLGLVLEVRDRYKLSEVRTATTWSEVKARVASQGWKAVLAEGRHVEFYVNPYPTERAGTDHFVVHTVRKLAGLGEPDHLPPNRKHVAHALGDAAKSLASILPLGELLVRVPDAVPGLLTLGMQSIVSNGGPYVDRGYRVLLLGSGIEAHGFEVAVPLSRVVDVVDTLVRIAREWNQGKPRSRSVLTSPFSLRFVRASPHLIAPSYGDPDTEVWCLLEVPRLKIRDSAEQQPEYPNYPHGVVQEFWQEIADDGARAHWG